MIGELVGGYRVTEKLGEGGMGVVFLAEHTIMGRKAAVKILHPNLSSDTEMVQRFFNEARAAGSISHPGIVGVFDMGLRDDGSAYIVMDFLEGESLARRLHRKGRLPGDEALAITRQILSALSAAHAQGIVHRDLKPDNIFLVPDADVPGGERIKLLDFGIAKLQGDGGANVITTRAGALMGTPVYMSPEQCRGAGECDQRTDLYAVGIMLFELLTGRPPFVANAVGELMAAHMRDTPPTLTDKLGPTSVELEVIVATLLAKSPDDRYASGEMAIAKIDSATHGVLSSGVRQPTQPIAPMDASLDPMAETALGTLPIHNTGGTTLRNTAGSFDVDDNEASAPAGSRSRAARWAMLAVASTALVAAGFFTLRETAAPSASSSTAPLPAPVSTVVSESDAAPIAESTPPRKATPRADVLPPVDIAAVADEAAENARQLHKRALTLHRAEAYDEAFAAYAEAITEDPGHVIARYNYACLLNLSGQTHEGLAILQQLKDAGCPVCLGRLIRARSDSEWKSAWDNPEFIALTQTVRLEQPSVHESGNQLADAVQSGTLTLAANLFAPRGSVSLVVKPANCRKRDCQEKTKVGSFDAFAAWFSEQTVTPSPAGQQKCARDCCRYKAGTTAGLQLSKMCTAIDSGSVRTISSLEFIIVE